MSAQSSKGTALITGASTGIGAVYADRLARHGPLPKKIPSPKNRHDSFLAALIDHRELNASFLDVHNAIRSFALRENGLLFAEFLNPSRCSDRLEKDLCVEVVFLRFHVWMALGARFHYGGTQLPQSACSARLRERRKLHG